MSRISSADFEWRTDPDVIIPEQCAIAVYLNGSGAIVIRQERAWDDDEDVCILVQPEQARCLVDAILRVGQVLDARALAAPAKSRNVPVAVAS